MHRAIVPAVAVVLLVAACGGDQESDQGPLTVYSGRAEELVGPLLADFTEQTSIEVDIRYAGSSELAATLLAEGDSTDADVFFAQDPASLGVVAPLFATLPDATLDLVEDRFHDDDGAWVGTSGRVRVVVYNKADQLELPETIDDMTAPQWAGQLGVAPTNASFLAFVSAMILERGEEGTRAWLEALAANDPVDFEGNAPDRRGDRQRRVGGGPGQPLLPAPAARRRIGSGLPRTTSYQRATPVR